MLYTDFTAATLNTYFGIVPESVNLFSSCRPHQPSMALQQTLEKNMKQPMMAEKQKLEGIVTPILTDIWKQYEVEIGVFTSRLMDIDVYKGLNGVCDFMINKDSDSLFSFNPPIFLTGMVTKHDNLVQVVPQIAAQALGAQLFNQQKGQPAKALYGCLTFGRSWLFVKLNSNQLLVDTEIYSLSNLPQLLGVLHQIIAEQT